MRSIASLLAAALVGVSCAQDPERPAPGDPPPTDVEDTAPPGRDSTPPASDLLTFRSGRPPSNLLVISIDTLRADYVSRMPFLSGLAAEGVHALDFRACSNWTAPAMSCAVGGRSVLDLAEETGVLHEIGKRANRWETVPFPQGTPFLAGWLGDAGFHSIVVTANPVFGPPRGLTQGYDTLRMDSDRPSHVVFDVGQQLLEAALPDLGSDPRWFLHLHVFDPHRAYDPPETYLSGLSGLDPIPYDLTNGGEHQTANEHIKGGHLTDAQTALVLEHMRVRYDGEVRWLDDEISAAFSDLDAAGLLDDTLLVVWSDHGEQFYEHGLQTHGNHLYAEEGDGLLFFWARDLEPATTLLPVSAVDVVPTTLGALGLPIPPEVTGLALDDIDEDRARFATAVGKVGPIATVERGGKAIHWAFADPARTAEADARAHAGLSWLDPTRPDTSYDPTDPELLELYALLQPEVQRMAPFVQPMGFEVLWPADLPAPP